MSQQTGKQLRSKGAFARPLIATVIGLQVLHAVLLLSLKDATFASNLFQLWFPLIALGVSIHQRTFADTAVEQRSWSALAFAFGIWAAAQAIFIYYLRYPDTVHWTVRPDDALWALFGLPLLLAVTTSEGEADRVSWLDRAQAVFFFAVLYLLMFLPSGRMPTLWAYLIQNIALVLCCILRIPICTLARERRFFVRLALFLLTYASLEEIGDLLYSHGWKVGSLADLVWTVPATFFILLTLRDAMLTEREQNQSGLLIRAVGSMQGLTVAALTFLSVGVSVLLCTRRPLLGGICVASSFTLFALRTNARERLWFEAHDQLEKTVLQDALTGLGNRLQLRKCLTERLAGTEWEDTALLFADLDRFKQINDTLGHALGDRLLVEVGGRLRGASTSDSVVCRLGGDEFVVLTTARTAAEAQKAGCDLLDALHVPMLIGVHELRLTASIGVVLAAPSETADDLLRTADHAMYRAKQLGRDRVQLFDAALRTQMNTRWHMESELQAYVESNSIQVAFQPIYCVEQRGICGFEALARWSHPVLGNVPPSEFITLAEESGLILALGAQMLEKACQQMATWNRAWGTNFSVSVNVSPRQFADSSLMPSILRILEQTGLPPSLLRLEITETALLTHEGIVKRTLEQARAHGIRISLDDFGTGYSSLSFLLSLPVDEVKVDRSFVSHMHEDPDREELVRTVIHLGHSLGKRVVAEGVETEEDLLGLARMGCECVQGYLISRPLSPEAVEADLSAIRAWGMSTRVPSPAGPLGGEIPPVGGPLAGRTRSSRQSD